MKEKLAVQVAKYRREDGQVAVLVSPGFGAGWSTWAGAELAEFAMFDSGLVRLALAGAGVEAVESHLKGKLGGEHFYTGGWSGITVEWLPAGTKFTIEEYDGVESLRLIEDLTFTA